MNRCPHSHCQVLKMYHIDPEPPNQTRTRERINSNQKQTLPPPPLIFGPETSPSPSSEHSTLTSNSFHSTGQQQRLDTNNPAEGNDGSNFLRPQISAFGSNQANNRGLNFVCNYNRHSSSSIDHKTLNLTKFADQHSGRNLINYTAEPSRYKRSTFGSHYVQSLNRQVSAEPSDRGCPSSNYAGEQYATGALTSAKRSNSFQQNRRALANQSQLANPKRCSVNFSIGAQHSPSPARLTNFQIHQSTPVPPPRAPADLDEDTSVSSLGKQSSDWSSRQMALQMRAPTNAMSNNGSKQMGDPANLISNNVLSQLDQQQQQQQQQGTDSLDNIHMIVDEDNAGSFALTHGDDQILDRDRFMFMTSDEPYKMSTLKVAGPAKKTVAFKQSLSGEINQQPELQTNAGLTNGALSETERKTLTSANAIDGAQNEHNSSNGLDHTTHSNDEMSLRQQQTIIPGYEECQFRQQEMQNSYNSQASHQGHRILIYDSRK